MSILVVATPFRHRGLDIFHIFPVTKALYLSSIAKQLSRAQLCYFSDLSL